MPRIPAVAAPTTTAVDSSTTKRTRACLASGGKRLWPRNVTARQIRMAEIVTRTENEVQAVGSRAVTGRSPLRTSTTTVRLATDDTHPAITEAS